jgi:hypothetical protein
MPLPNTPNYYAVPFPMFQRAMRNILSITQAEQAVVTTTFDGINPGDHQYQTGLTVRLNIPNGFGMAQANQVEGPITVLSSTQFSLPLNTINFDAFVIPSFQPGNNGTPATVTPVGELNDILTESTQNALPYP